MKGWLKPKAAAEYADVGERTYRTWLKEDGLRSIRVKGIVLTKIEWIDNFLEQHELKPERSVDNIVSEVCRDLH
jgi:hypothetical protein